MLLAEQRHLAAEQSQLAMTWYHSHFDPAVYCAAVHKRSVAYANALLDEAMAMCGSPFYKLSWRHWSPAAMAFLQLFAR